MEVFSKRAFDSLIYLHQIGKLPLLIPQNEKKSHISSLEICSNNNNKLEKNVHCNVIVSSALKMNNKKLLP